MDMARPAGGVLPEEPAPGRADEGQPSDGHLLGRYLADRDELAFAALVHRYSSLVLAVCARVLQDRHAAEDASQATFLALALQGRSLDRGRPLGGWLATVAFRQASKVKARNARRKVKEKRLPTARALPPEDGPMREEVRAALDRALGRLPDKYRLPVVLCYLDGKTHVQAARELGCPSGSVSRRMEQALARLREELPEMA